MLSECRASRVQYIVGQALLVSCSFPKAGKLLGKRTRFACRCTLKSPALINLRTVMRKPDSAFVPACLLQAVQEQNNSRRKGDTRLAAIL